MGHEAVVLGLHQQHIPGELRTGPQRQVVLGVPGNAPIALQAHHVELVLGHVPVIVPVERRHPQGQPFHRPQGGEEGRQVAAVAAADHRNGLGVDGRVLGEAVIGRHYVGEVVLAGHAFLGGDGLLVAAQVEGQADAAEPGDALGPLQVALLAAAPAMHEENARDLGLGRE
ncbi:hypothetical protein D3C81_1725550 [compost metagenome]